MPPRTLLVAALLIGTCACAAPDQGAQPDPSSPPSTETTQSTACPDREQIEDFLGSDDAVLFGEDEPVINPDAALAGQLDSTNVIRFTITNTGTAPIGVGRAGFLHDCSTGEWSIIVTDPDPDGATAGRIEPAGTAVEIETVNRELPPGEEGGPWFVGPVGDVTASLVAAIALVDPESGTSLGYVTAEFN